MNNTITINRNPAGIYFMGILLCVLTLSSCASKDVTQALSRADELMWTKPDSALAVLESVDTLDLKTRAQRAEFSLLYTMAFDRNHLTIPNLHIIEPAVRYYERHGSKDTKMKMYFYLGVAQYDTGDLESAIVSYIRAKEYSLYSDNLMFKGLISFVISDVFFSDKNYPESISYCKEACDYFAQAKDSLRLWSTTGCLASYYLNAEDWTKADSLYSVFFSQPILDTAIYSRQLFNLAWSNIFRPDFNPQESVDLFEKSISKYNGKPSVNDYCVYAYASEMLGNTEVADDIVGQLERAGADSVVLDTWRYRIFKHKGNYKDALALLEQTVRAQDSEILKTIDQSVALAQSDYYESKSLLLDKDRRIQSQSKWIVLLLCLLLVVSFVIIHSILKRKWQFQIEEMSSINEAVGNRLKDAILCSEERQQSINVLVSENELAKRKIENLSDKLYVAQSEQMIVNLRNKYIQAYKGQYHQLNDLCHKYWEASRLSKGGKDKIYAEVKKIVAVLDEQNQKQLEAMIDDSLDGMMSKLRLAMPGTNEKDFRFIALIILGFDTKTIARIMKYNVGTVYTKRSNIKEKLQKIECEEKELVLALIS
mgnify:FL=1